MKMEGELEQAKSEIEKLKLTLNEKESMIQHLSCATTKLRNDSEANLSKLQEENSRLLNALDEADEKNKAQETAIGALKMEAENIRALLCDSQKKCTEAEMEAKELKEASRKEDVLVRLEDGKRKLEDQLKWKKEQFEHLRQAHEKMKAQFEESKREWDSEKSSLLEGMSKLQSSLDSQTSRAESFKTQLDMCRQALSHEESRRQNLESRISEMKTSLESVSEECWEAKSRAYTCTAQTDDQTSALRDSLREKESELKDAEYKAKKLETENQELLNSIRELQEAHIPKAASTPPSAMAKIKSKLRSLEHAQKSKEAEWDLQIQMMRKDLDEHKFCLKIKEASIKDLKKDLEDCNATNTELKMQNEELSLMLQLLRTEFSETQSAVTPTVDKAEDETDLNCKQNEDNEIQKYKEMLDESYREQASLKQKIRELGCALERLNCELTEKVCEVSEIEFELQIWTLTAERLQARLEENQRLRRELELSLLAQAGFEEELKLEMSNLKQQFGLLELDDKNTLPMMEEDRWPMQEEESVNKQIFNMVKSIEISASDERSPFRVIN